MNRKTTGLGPTRNDAFVPDWVTVKVCPATVKAPARAPESVFDVIEKASVPVPEPDEPEVIVSQGALLTAVQEQPLFATTPIVPLPPVDVNT